MPGYRKTKVHYAWASMLQRCNNPKSQKYPRYGGRGIKVCDEWHTFSNFLADMGEPPEGMTLDRIDTNGNYCKENCRWASPKEQARNRTNNTPITAFGQTKTLAEWAESAHVTSVAIRQRINRGWTPEEAVSAPPNNRRCCRAT